MAISKSKEKLVFSQFIRAGKEALAKRDMIILDATFLNSYIRRKAIRDLENAFKGEDMRFICCWVQTPVDKCKERNALRKGFERVPDAAIDRLVRTIEAPEICEGFEYIHYLDSEGNLMKSDK